MAAGKEPQVLRQEGRAFVPHVLPIERGTPVEFPNLDPVYHNVFSLSESATFDLGRYPRGASRSIRFDTSGIVKVFCHLHSEMSAVILVLDNPWFAVPESGGRYSILDIPPGDYRVVAFHERAHHISRGVRIEAGRTAKIDFTIPLLEPADGV